MRAVLSLLLALATSSTPTLAHEYWIEVEKFQTPSPKDLTADLRVGSDLSGEVFPWLRQSFVSVSMFPPDGDPIPLTGRAGDLPALSFAPTEEGLHRLAVETTPSFVIFDDPATFQSYVEYEGFPEILMQHRARGLPETGFGERFVRNARALVQVGPIIDGQSDAPTGMPLELVAEGNPYRPELAEIAVRLTWMGTPLPDTQIALFHASPTAKRPDEVSRMLFSTDMEGRVIIPIKGEGLHLLSAVRIEPVEDSSVAAWQSWWASLTFSP